MTSTKDATANTAVTLATRTNAGTTTVYAYFVPTDVANYNSLGSSSNDHTSASVVISKATPTMTLTGASKTYDGTTYYVSGKASVAGTIYYGTTSATSGMTSTKAVSANTATNITGRKDYGTTTVYAYFVPTDGTNYNSLGSSSNDHTSASVTISKATPTLTFNASSSTLTYNGSTQNIGTISYTGDGKFYYVVSTSTTVPTTGWTEATSGATIKSSAATATTYYVYLKSDAGTNYAAVSAASKGSKSIGKATPTLTFNASSSTLTYNGSTQNIGTISYTGDGTFYYVVSTSTTVPTTGWTSASSGATIKSSAATAATYYVYLKSDAGTNYVAVSAASKGSKAIGKATPTLTLTGTTITYDGSSTATVKASANVAGTIYYGTSTSMGSTQSATASTTYTLATRTDAGTTTVYAAFVPTDGTNYKSLGSSSSYNKSASAKVNAASSTLTLTGASKTYDGNPSYVSATASAAGIIYYGATSGAKTYNVAVSAGGTVNLTSMGRTSAGTTTVYAYLDPSTANYNNSDKVNATITINKANGTITFSPANKSVQCKNSSTQMTAADVVTCTSATGATGTITYTLNTGNTTLSNCSLSGTKLTVPKDTAVGDYTISITANSAATTNYTSASQTSTFTLSVVADTLKSGYSGTLSINSSADLSAGADSRTITWGAIYQTWENGGGKYYPSNNAYLEISCSNSTAGGYMSINKSSYTNSSSTTTSTLTKTTFDVTELNASTLTISLKNYSYNTVETLTVDVSQNEKTLSGETILNYGTPSITIASGITAANSSATVSCSADDTVQYTYEYTSGKTSRNVTGKSATVSWKIYSQLCVGGTNRFTKQSSTTLSHSTMGTSEGTDTATLIAQNDNDTSKTKTVSTSANNYKRHQLTSLSLSYATISYNELTNTPTVKYDTTYDYLSGASGGTTSNQTEIIIGTNTTLSKTFKVISSHYSASLNTSTGDVTWSGNNTTTSARSCVIQCTGTLLSNGVTTVGTSTTAATQNCSNIGLTINTTTVPSGVTLYMNVNGATSQLSTYTTKTVKITSMGSSAIAFYVTKNSSGSSRILSMSYSGGGATSVSVSPTSRSVTIPNGINTTNTNTYCVTMTIIRNSASNVGGYSISVGVS